METSGSMYAKGIDFDPSRVLFEETRPHSYSFAHEPVIVPGVPYEHREDFFDEQRFQSGEDASVANSIGGLSYHADDTGAIGQPDSAFLYLNGFSSAYASYRQDTMEIQGQSNASVTNTTKARIRIHDEDNCYPDGTPVTGQWSLLSRAGVYQQSEIDPGTASLNQDVTFRYFRFDRAVPGLVLDTTIELSIPVGSEQLLMQRLSEDFDLTIGGEIEVEVTTRASAVSSSTADFNDLRLEISVNPPTGSIRLNNFTHFFTHFVRPNGTIDPQWLEVDYEVVAPACHFDLELSALADDQTTPEGFDTFRIDETTVMESPRFQIFNPDQREIDPDQSPGRIGRHLLLIDGSNPSLQHAFGEGTNRLITVHEPQRYEDGSEFHGFYLPAPIDRLVIRSDAETSDQILLDDLSAEFRFGDAVSRYAFPLDPSIPLDQPPETTIADVLVVTVGADDAVMAGPTFDVPIEARLGNGNDVFVGGANADVAHGGDGNDALLGEGWDTDVTSLGGLLQDMLDLKFTLAARLVPAGGTGDVLYGDGGDDFLVGGAGDDTLESGTGRSLIFGDGLSSAEPIDVAFDDVSFAEDINFEQSGSGSDRITVDGLDALVMAGAGDDTITANTTRISRLFGNDGMDTISNDGEFALIAGGNGNDRITGGGLLAGDSFDFSTLDSVNLLALKRGYLPAGTRLTSTDTGADTIHGGRGFDFVVGGDGDDMINFNNGGFALNIVFADGIDLYVNPDDERLELGINFPGIFNSDRTIAILSKPDEVLDLFNRSLLLTGTGNDLVDGGLAIDVVFGGAGDDMLNGNTSFDFLVGGEGDDTIDTGRFDSQFEEGDVVLGGPGDDLLSGSDGPDYMESEQGNDTFLGFDGDDVIFGGADADMLDGGPGNDRLYGEGGDDQIIGGEGDDWIYGGAGIDEIDGGAGSNIEHQDPVAPQVLAIVPVIGAADPTAASSLAFSVAFDARVTGIDVNDFVLNLTGTATGNISSVSTTEGQTVVVTIDTVAGTGTLGLNFDPNTSDSVTDEFGNAALEGFEGLAYTIDPNTPTLVVAESSGTTIVSEDGTSDSLDMVLSVRPDTNVVVELYNSAVHIQPDVLTFSSDDWNVAQQVTISAVDNSTTDGDRTTTVTAAVNTQESDPAWQRAAVRLVRVTVNDNDRSGDLNIDGNAVADALSDGILVLRYLAGFTGDALIDNAVDLTGGTRTTAQSIADYLATIRDWLDVDGNDARDPLSDGILVIRFLAGFSGEILTASAVDTNGGTRTSPEQVIEYLMPYLPLPAESTSAARSSQPQFDESIITQNNPWRPLAYRPLDDLFARQFDIDLEFGL